MPRLLFIMLFVLGFAGWAGAQTAAPDYELLIAQGLELYENDHNAEALERFEKALKIKPNDFRAQYGMALVYYTTGRYVESAALCELLVKRGDDKLPNLYVTYGTSLDRQHKSVEAAQVYRQAILKFPDDEPLYRYQGIALQNLKRYEEAANSFQQALRRRPDYANTHLLLAKTETLRGQRIPALLACIRAMMLETNGATAAAEGKILDQLLQAGVRQTGPQAVALNLQAEMLEQAGSPAKDATGFASTEVLLTMEAALDFDAKNKDKSPSERLNEKLSALCQSLDEQNLAQRQGFTWQFYAPFFISLNKQGHLLALVYLLRAMQPATAPAAIDWVKQHRPQTQAMLAWAKAYKWPD
jgi:tetratricopeptide (TPR) repeat protein